MFRETSRHSSDLLQRQRALLRWENEGGAIQSAPVNPHAHNAGTDPGTSGVPEIEVDAAVIGKGLEMDPSLVPGYLRRGTITSLCERGVGEDDGQYRLTFYFEKRRFRILTNRAGNVIQDG